MKTLNITLSILALGIIGLTLVLVMKPLDTATGAGWFGYSSYLQHASTTAVGPQTVKTLATAKTDGSCKSRVVTTNNNGINLSFGDATLFSSTTLTATKGHYQAASTTVVYDSGLYGCGRMTALGLIASGTVTVSEF